MEEVMDQTRRTMEAKEQQAMSEMKQSLAAAE